MDNLYGGYNIFNSNILPLVLANSVTTYNLYVDGIFLYTNYKQI